MSTLIVMLSWWPIQLISNYKILWRKNPHKLRFGASAPFLEVRILRCRICLRIFQVLFSFKIYWIYHLFIKIPYHFNRLVNNSAFGSSLKDLTHIYRGIKASVMIKGGYISWLNLSEFIMIYVQLYKLSHLAIFIFKHSHQSWVQDFREKKIIRKNLWIVFPK